MQHQSTNLSEIDPVWQRISDEARDAIAKEPLLGGLLHGTILHHKTLERALSFRISEKLASAEMSAQILREISDEAFRADPCHRFLQPLVYFKGFQAIQAYRVGHWLWRNGRKDLSYFFQMRS